MKDSQRLASGGTLNVDLCRLLEGICGLPDYVGGYVQDQ